ncbi:MAG: nucleotide disphospho-sugar-binding domain-containing protein [Xanthobacteraceae bacterium]
MPAPVLHALREGQTGEASYAQVLAAAGFVRRRDLAAMVATWDDVFAMAKPDLIVAEHSPIASLAARGRIPVVVTGTGFTVPPSHTQHFPAFRKGVDPPAVHRRMLDVINSLLQARGVSPLQRVPELIAGDRRAIFSLPHLDPYGPLRKDRLLGPYVGRLKPTPPPKPSIYLYSRATEERLDDMVEVILGFGGPVSAYITGPDCPARTLLESRGARIYDRPPDMQQALGTANIVVSNGGAGVTGAALMIGRAQVIIPIHVESEVNAARVEATGSAMIVAPFDKRTFCEAIETVMQVRLFHERAEATAREIAALDLPENPLDEAARLCDELL